MCSNRPGPVLVIVMFHAMVCMYESSSGAAIQLVSLT